MLQKSLNNFIVEQNGNFSMLSCLLALSGSEGREGNSDGWLVSYADERSEKIIHISQVLTSFCIQMVQLEVGDCRVAISHVRQVSECKEYNNEKGNFIIRFTNGSRSLNSLD